MQKPFTVSAPYPTLKNVKEDYYSASIVAPLYAGLHGELVSALRFGYQSYFFSGKVLELIDGIVGAEIIHLDILGETLYKLGYDPVYAVKKGYSTEYFSTESVSYFKTPKKMLLDDVALKEITLLEYEKAQEKLKGKAVLDILKRISADEVLHLTALENALADLNGI